MLKTDGFPDWLCRLDWKTWPWPSLYTVLVLRLWSTIVTWDVVSIMWKRFALALPHWCAGFQTNLQTSYFLLRLHQTVVRPPWRRYNCCLPLSFVIWKVSSGKVGTIIIQSFFHPMGNTCSHAHCKLATFSQWQKPMLPRRQYCLMLSLGRKRLQF